MFFKIKSRLLLKDAEICSILKYVYKIYQNFFKNNLQEATNEEIFKRVQGICN